MKILKTTWLFALIIPTILNCKKTDNINPEPQASRGPVSKMDGTRIFHGTDRDKRWDGITYSYRDTTYIVENKEMSIHRLSDSAILVGVGYINSNSVTPYGVFLYLSGSEDSLVFQEQGATFDTGDLILYKRLTYFIRNDNMFYEYYFASVGGDTTEEKLYTR